MQEDDPLLGGGPQGDPNPPPSGGPIVTYELIGMDPNGKAVYQGSDGQRYTDGNGPNGMVPYSGPGPQQSPSPTPTPTGNPPPTGGGDPGGSLTAPFTGQYTPYTPQALPTVGGSVGNIPGAPQFPNIPKFTSPTVGEAMEDPGYQFVLQQGNNNLQNWAAARGTLNDSSTAKALTDYGQGAASTQYGNVWDRAMNTYRTNTDTQYIQPWQAQYQNWMTGTVGPTMAQYNTNAANTAHLNDVNWQDNWNSYLQQFNQFRDQRDSTWSKRFAVATA